MVAKQTLILPLHEGCGYLNMHRYCIKITQVHSLIAHLQLVQAVQIILLKEVMLWQRIRDPS